MTLRAPLSMSPSMAGKLLLAGKYAKKLGDCQCVSPACVKLPDKTVHVFQPAVFSAYSQAISAKSAGTCVFLFMHGYVLHAWTTPHGSEHASGRLLDWQSLAMLAAHCCRLGRSQAGEAAEVADLA